VCGRFALYIQAGAFLDVFGCPPPDALEPRYNIVPDRDIVAIVQTPESRRAGRLRWGLLPPWADSANDRARQINARSETVFEKPMFKSATLRHRCLIPASGFYEWQKRGKMSQPYFIHHADEAPVAMAGIWRRSSFGDTTVVTCAILTMDAYPAFAGIHHRMPVMLDPGAWDAWLNPDSRDPARLKDSLRPLPEDAVVAREVGRAVNNPANDGPQLLCPEEMPSASAQGALF
jgi:putative SOS response-associated peptidase YedK